MSRLHDELVQLRQVHPKSLKDYSNLYKDIKSFKIKLGSEIQRCGKLPHLLAITASISTYEWHTLLNAHRSLPRAFRLKITLDKLQGILSK